MITRWSPDTCASPPCDIEFDDSTTLTTYRSKCSYHTALSDAAAYTATKDENTRKNLSLVDTATVNAAAVPTSASTFNDVRTVMTLSLPDASAGEKTTIQGLVDTRFGSGKVTIT